MVKASNLIKKLLPIGLVIGGLYFLSQSKRVNIFRTTQAPDITIQPAQAFPLFINEPQIIPVPFQETKESLIERFGPLFKQEGTRKVLTESTQREVGRIFAEVKGSFGPNSRATANIIQQYPDVYGLKKEYEEEPVYVPLFNLE